MALGCGLLLKENAVSQPDFPGFPAFLDVAAARTGHREAAGRARSINAVAALSNLCAQSLSADAAGAQAILLKAGEFRDELLVAYRAAELMLIDAYARRGLARPAALDDCSAIPARSARPLKKTIASS